MRMTGWEAGYGPVATPTTSQTVIVKNIPVLKAVVFDEAVDASCFGKAWELIVDPPAISASTLEVGFLF